MVGKYWNYSDDVSFRLNFRITKGTILFILAEVKEDLQRETTAEVPIPPELDWLCASIDLAEGTTCTLLEN